MLQIFLLITLIILISLYSYIRIKGSLKYQYSWVPFLKGINLFISNNSSEAIEFLITILEKQKANPYKLWLLGNLYREKGWIDQAIRCHQNLLEEKKIPADLQQEILFSLGNDYYKAGMIERAIFYYRKLIDRYKNYAEAYYQLEKIYEELKDWRKTIELQEIIVSKSHSERQLSILSFLHNELGEELMKAHKYLESIKEFREAICIDRKNFLAYINMGKAYYNLKECQQAMLVWEQLLEEVPTYAYFLFDDLFKLYDELSLEYKKQSLLEKIRMQLQKNWKAQEFLYRYYSRNSRYDDSLEYLLRALEIKPDSLLLQRELWNLIMRSRREIIEDQRFISYIDFLDKQATNEALYTCHLCKYKSQDYLKKCPHCHEWGTFKEII